MYKYASVIEIKVSDCYQNKRFKPVWRFIVIESFRVQLTFAGGHL